MSELQKYFGPDKKILIVDDVASSRRVIEQLLKSIGLAHFLHAANGKDAMEEIQKGGVALVISDWDMPVMDGIALRDAMKALTSSEKIPFVMVTSSSDKESVTYAIEKKVFHYVIKPFSSSVLGKKIAEIMTSTAS